MIDPGFENLGFMVYDSLKHRILQWQVQNPTLIYDMFQDDDMSQDDYNRTATMKKRFENLSKSKKKTQWTQDQIADMISVWLRTPAIQSVLDAADLIWVEHQFQAFLQQWYLAIYVMYPNKTHYLHPRKFLCHFGLSTGTYLRNKKASVDWMLKTVNQQFLEGVVGVFPVVMQDGSILPSVGCLDCDMEDLSFTILQNLATPYIMMRYLQDTI